MRLKSPKFPSKLLVVLDLLLLYRVVFCFVLLLEAVDFLIVLLANACYLIIQYPGQKGCQLVAHRRTHRAQFSYDTNLCTEIYRVAICKRLAATSSTAKVATGLARERRPEEYMSYRRRGN